MRRSPAPKPPSRTWVWLVSALAVWLVALVIVAVSSPWWGRDLIREQVEAKIATRLDLPVAIASIDLGLEQVVLHDVVIGEADAPLVRLDLVEVGLDASAWWDARVVVQTVAVRGGRVDGSRAQLEELASRARNERSGDGAGGSGRLRLSPSQVTLDELWLVVGDEQPDARVRHLESRVSADLDPRALAADVTLADLRVELRDQPLVTAAKLHAQLEAIRSDDGLMLQFPLRVDLSDFGSAVTDEIAVADVDGWVELSDRHASEITVALDGGFSDRGDHSGDGPRLWSVGGSVRRDLSAGRLRVDMGEFELGRVPEVLRRLPLVDSARASVGGHLAVAFGGGVARVEGDVSLAGLTVDHPVLAKEPVRDIGVDVEFAAELDPQAYRVRLERATIERSGIRMEVEGELQHPPERRHRRYRLHATIPPVPCQNVLDAIPPQLIPSLQGFLLDGEFELDFDFDADFADLDRLVLAADVGIDHCEVRQAPADASPERLAGGFTHRVTMRDGRQRTVQLFAHSGSFTPLQQISPYMVKAVLTTEDGGFWRHKGFLPSQFRTAMQRNFAADEVRLGASTITMQMVKNVLLSHQRTLSRKLQELFLTWYVERTLSKERIMEIYLNVIEFGPGIYGVTRAARHYFGKYPDEITPPEAAYLALMLPSPVRRHVSWCRGAPTPSMQVKLARILSIMHERGRLDDVEYELWREVPLEFDVGERGSEGACLAEIDALMSAQGGQRALSGLMAGGPTTATTLDDEVAEVDAEAMRELELRRASEREGAQVEEGDAPGRPAMDDGADGETW